MKINFLLIYSNFIPLTISLVMPRANISSSAEYKCNNHMACIQIQGITARSSFPLCKRTD
ncbi:hypothetical protein ACB098_10G083500 [Castanea mollissima]